ncbi:MAG: T9SS type A sorting domain-containing protein, partial [Saprospiraceae bacterium]
TLTADSDIQSWVMYNALGSVAQRAEDGNNSQNLVIQVDELPSGLYYLIVQTAKGSVKRSVEVVR